MKKCLLILLLLAACREQSEPQQSASATQAQPENIAPHNPPVAETTSPKIVQSARNQIGKTVRYDPAYTALAYPMGDVPLEKGVCTDVVIRALREQNMDLQVLVHNDMRRHFSAYPKRWGLTRPTQILTTAVCQISSHFSRDKVGRCAMASFKLATS